jgi:23S rRNA pseudouridine2605 synthase
VPERLQKILSRAGIASRRGAEKVMAEGRVTVNGETVRELGSKADVQTDDIRVDGVRLRAPAAPVYLVLNKPKGVVTTRHDPEGRPTVMAYVPSVAGLFPVGRLDVTTEGLILLTSDGDFAERVSHPRYEVPRVYHAKVHGVPDGGALERMRRGVSVEGERMTADRVRILEADNNAWVEVVVHEGKHHEVRRLLEAVGHPVSKLRRVALGPVTTRGLKPGEFRHLTESEVKALRRGGDAGPAPARLERRRKQRPASKPKARARTASPRGGPERRRGRSR